MEATIQIVRKSHWEYCTNGPNVQSTWAPNHSVSAHTFPAAPFSNSASQGGVCSGHFCSLTVKWEHCRFSHLKSSLFFQHSFPQLFSAMKVTIQWMLLCSSQCHVLGQQCCVFEKVTSGWHQFTVVTLTLYDDTPFERAIINKLYLFR